MSHETSKTYWKSPAERDGLVPDAAPNPHGRDPSGLSRRQFLEAAGFTLSVATLGGCGRALPETALPFAEQPEGVVPGRTLTYASTCAGCPAACGLLVGVRDGRPLKMEGMPEHPLSHGGLCAIGQALPLGLYDSRRLRRPQRDGKPAKGKSPWNQVDQAIKKQLDEIASSGGAVRFVTPTVTSPTLKASIDEFLSPFSDARHVTSDAVSSSAILDAHKQTHGARILPHYKLDAAQVIVSFGADFLGTWISPVEFTAAWQTRRAPSAEHPEMSRHIQFESRMSLSGANADERHRLASDEYAIVLSHLLVQLDELAGESPAHEDLADSPIAAAELAKLAQTLWSARGESVVLCDSQDVATQVLVNAINHRLGNYGKTLDIDRPSRQRQGNDAEVLAFVDELKAGKIAALLVAGTDLTHNLPDRAALAKAIGEVPLVVSLADHMDDFSSLADFVCPDLHSLESWLDAEPVRGLFSLSQPTIAPIIDTSLKTTTTSRSILESLARWSGRNESAYEIVRATWKNQIMPRFEATEFPAFWDQALHDGFAEATSETSAPVTEFQSDAVKLASRKPSATDLTLTLYSKVGLTDSRHAHNPWLQELPDPTTKVTWDNYVCVPVAVATELGVADGDVVRVETSDGQTRIELPALVQPGQHDRVLAIALAYGVKGTDRFANIGPEWLESRPPPPPPPPPPPHGRAEETRRRERRRIHRTPRRSVALLARRNQAHQDRRTARPRFNTVASLNAGSGKCRTPRRGDARTNSRDNAGGVRQGSSCRNAGGASFLRHATLGRRPSEDRASLGYGRRLEQMHGMLGLRDRVPIGKQHSGGRQG